MPSDDPDFSKFHFNPPDRVDRKWLEWFREEFGRRAFGVDMEPDPDVPLSLEGTSRLLPGLSAYGGTCSPVRSRIASDVTTDDIVALTVALAGDLCFKVGGRDFELTAGAAVFGGGDARGVLDVRSNARFLTICLSSRLLAPLVPNVADLGAVPIPVGSQATRLLLGYVRMLDAEDRIDSPEARRLAVTHLCDLVVLALGPSRDASAVANARGVRAARLAAIKSDILDNLARPDLSAPSIAARHGVTRRYVDMLFESEGVTFSEFVVGQRLAQAHRMLTDPRFAHRTVNAIALDVGFGDLSYFNRTFRRRYGATPSDVRNAANPEN